MNSAPPIGIMPEKFWLERRITELQEAINRYEEAGLPVPNEWREEIQRNLFLLKINESAAAKGLNLQRG